MTHRRMIKVVSPAMPLCALLIASCGPCDRR